MFAKRVWSNKEKLFSSYIFLKGRQAKKAANVSKDRLTT